MPMNKDIVEYAKTRHTAKAYDSNKKISDDDIEKVKELLRYSPSSVNSQPWHFIITSSTEGKERIAKSTARLYPFNSKAILDASHVIVFCSKLDINDDYLLNILEQEDKDKRFISDVETKKKTRFSVQNTFINMHKHDYKDLQHWIDKQTYLNLGFFLLGISTLGIDATPMEGIETKLIDEEFELRQKGYSSLVVVPIGYHEKEADFNAQLPKSRLPLSEIVTEV
jgi:nitroreductase/dihydropteridine reductase